VDPTDNTVIGHYSQSDIITWRQFKGTPVRDFFLVFARIKPKYRAKNNTFECYWFILEFADKFKYFCHSSVTKLMWSLIPINWVNAEWDAIPIEWAQHDISSDNRYFAIIAEYFAWAIIIIIAIIAHMK
jgi:hypothetical protein